MEKLEKAKHNHLFTDILKIVVFGLIIILPFIVLTPTCLYYGFNEHATNENYKVTEKYQTNEVNSTNDLIEGNIYYCNKINIGLYDNFYDFTLNIYKFENFNFIDSDYSIDEVYAGSYDSKYNNYLQIVFYDDYTDGSIMVYYTNEDNYTAVIFEPYTTESDCLIFNKCYFTFSNNEENSFQQYVLDVFENNPTSSDYNILEYEQINNITDNISYAWEEMWNTNLFSWTKNSPFKTSINGFLAVFQIPQQSGLGLYLNYLITMTGIYVVIDIVIELFKWLTHLIGNK